MTALPTTTPEWTSDDAKTLADFLESSTGRRAIESVAGDAPQLLDGTDVNKTLVASGRVWGYGEALQNLFRLTTVQPPQPQQQPRSSHPDLDDESQWNGAELK